MFVCSITRHKYLHESSVPTMHFQDSLPHLKVPKLDDTVERYLHAQKVILTDEEYKKTEAITKEFQTGSQGKGDQFYMWWCPHNTNEKSKIPFSYMLCLFCKRAYRGTKPEESFGWGYRSLFFLPFPSFIFSSTGSDSRFWEFHPSSVTLGVFVFSLSWSSVNPWPISFIQLCT